MRALLDLLVPSLCDGCGARAAPPWCAACDDIARSLRPRPPCRRCAGPDQPGHACWVDGAPVAGTVALSQWTGPVARTVLQAKLGGRREVLVALGRRLAALEELGGLPADAVVVPVPTDPRRRRQRGLDHTAVLAAAVGGGLRRPVVAALRVGRRVADRGRAAVGERGELPSDVFVATTRAAQVAGRPVLLVDDLVTTGATVAAAAAVLHDCGAAQVDVAVIARAGRHRLGGAARALPAPGCA